MNEEYIKQIEKQFKTFSNGTLIILGLIIVLSISVVWLKWGEKQNEWKSIYTFFR